MTGPRGEKQVSALELRIIPDMFREAARTSLNTLRLA